MKLKDKIAVVAGGGQGIGEGIVLCLAEEGADIAVIDINAETAGSVAKRVKGMGRKALPVVADLTEEEQVNRAIKETIDFFGRIDILVNNVGGASPQMEQKMAEYLSSVPDRMAPQASATPPADVWDATYRLNLKSHVMLCNAVVPRFIEQRSGKIVNIASVSGRQPEPGNVAYAAMKAGDVSFTWSLAKALAPFNVNVNCVCPGLVYTPLWHRGAVRLLERMRARARKMEEKGEEMPLEIQWFAKVDLQGTLTPKEFWLQAIMIPSTPLGREQTPEDIGRAVAFLASEDARNITGQVLHVDGGLCMR